jgi:hypothetical protein
LDSKQAIIKKKGDKIMHYYEILNKKTLEKAQGVAKNLQAMCKALDWRPQDCRLIWKAKPENAGDPAQY